MVHLKIVTTFSIFVTLSFPITLNVVFTYQYIHKYLVLSPINYNPYIFLPHLSSLNNDILILLLLIVCSPLLFMIRSNNINES